MNAGTRGAYGLAIAIAACSIASLASPLVADALEYQRAAIASGELWRLVTGQLIHIGPTHLLMNLAALAALALVGARHRSGAFALPTLALLHLGTAFGLFFVAPQVDWYRGASGVLHGAALWVLVDVARGTASGGQRVAALVGCGILVGKVALESLDIGTWDSAAQIGARVVHEAHLAGTATAALGLVAQAWRKSSPQ